MGRAEEVARSKREPTDTDKWRARMEAEKTRKCELYQQICDEVPRALQRLEAKDFPDAQEMSYKAGIFGRPTTIAYWNVDGMNLCSDGKFRHYTEVAIKQEQFMHLPVASLEQLLAALRQLGT